MTALRLALAQRRAAPLLRKLAATSSRKKQLAILVDKPCVLSAIGWTGGPFDLEILLEDPAFTIPWRRRSTTERMIAAATGFVRRAAAGE